MAFCENSYDNQNENTTEILNENSSEISNDNSNEISSETADEASKEQASFGAPESSADKENGTPYNNQNGAQYTYRGNTQGSAQGNYGGYNQSPSQIYTSTGNTGAPQYHYGRPIPMMDNRYFYEQQERIKKRRDLKKELRKTGLFPGLALILFLIINSIFGTVLALSPLYNSYFVSSSVSSAVGIFYSIFVVALSFVAVHYIYKAKNRTGSVSFGPSRLSPGKTALIIFGCIGGCMLANYVTNFIVEIFYIFGIEFEYSLGPDPTNFKEIILLFVGTAIVPPLTEELAIRGFALTYFKKYGNTFAILASAFVFAIFHGNPTQIPFAFICGLFLGYAALATGTIWTSIIVHGAVNGLSCLYSAAELFAGEEAANAAVGAITVLLLVVGVFCAVVYIAKYKKTDSTLGNAPCEELTVGEKFKYFLTNPLMIIVTVIFVIEALMQISLVSQ